MARARLRRDGYGPSIGSAVGGGARDPSARATVGRNRHARSSSSNRRCSRNELKYQIKTKPSTRGGGHVSKPTSLADVEGFRELPELQHHKSKTGTRCARRASCASPARSCDSRATSRRCTTRWTRPCIRAGTRPSGSRRPLPPTPIRLDVLGPAGHARCDGARTVALLGCHRCLGLAQGSTHGGPRGHAYRLCGPSQARHVRGCRLLHGDHQRLSPGKIDLTLDPPEQRREIGTCELCAHDAHRRRGRPVGYLSRVRTGNSERRRSNCVGSRRCVGMISRRGSAAEIAKAFTGCRDTGA